MYARRCGSGDSTIGHSQIRVETRDFMTTNFNPYALVVFAGFLYLMNWAFQSGNALAALGVNVLLCLVLWPVAGEMVKNWMRSWRGGRPRGGI